MMPPPTPPISERERLSRIRRPWSSEEDEVLRKYVVQHGEHNWRFVEDHLDRHRKSCRERWKCVLRFTVARNPLTDEEKARIRQLYRMVGGRWDTIRKYTVGDDRFLVPRSEFDIKNYIDQVLLEQAQNQDLNPDYVDDNDGNLQAPEGSSHGNQSLDLSLSIGVPPSEARNIDINAPAASDEAPD